MNLPSRNNKIQTSKLEITEIHDFSYKLTAIAIVTRDLWNTWHSNYLRGSSSFQINSDNVFLLVNAV